MTETPEERRARIEAERLLREKQALELGHDREKFSRRGGVRREDTDRKVDEITMHLDDDGDAE